MGYASTVVAALLIGPLTWSHSLLLLLLASPIFWAASRQITTRVALVIIAAILSINPRFYWTDALKSGEMNVAKPALILGAISVQFYALALLFIIGIVLTATSPGNVGSCARDGTPPGGEE